MFLNFMLCPAVLAEDVQSMKGEQFDTYLAPALRGKTNNVTQDSADNVQSTADVTVQNTADTAPQPNVSNRVTADVSNQTPTPVLQTSEQTAAQNPDTEKTEHLAVRKNNSKKIDVETVYITSHNAEIPANDILQVAFVNDFNGRRARVGDTIEFRFPNDIVTQEGTMIIPSTARIIAEITKLKKPKPLHLSGKVYLKFKYIEVNGVRKPIEAKLCSKKEYLSRKALNNTTAIGETVVTYGAGAAAGAAIGAGSASTVCGVILCGTFGAGLGAAIGLGVGILLPGASFKAKAGQRVNIQLTQELDL